MTRAGPQGMGSRAWGSSLVVAVLLACGPAACGAGSGAGPSGDPTAVPGASQAPPSVLAGQVGQELQLVVPLLGGGRQALAELRGRPVLLELADAGWSGRDEAQGRYRALAQRHGDGVAVVCVALDREVATLPASWTDHAPPFVLGWDPQGALAARLRLRVLPTVVLLDATGRIVAVHEGTPPDDAALDRWLATR